jgi:serine phosphatase RsbU (regulator of sigma subunit)
MTEPTQRQAGQLLWSLLVVAGIAGIAYADWRVESYNVAFDYIYFIPLALSALMHRLRTSLLLAVSCVFLQDWFGPLSHEGWERALHNAWVFLGYATVIVVVTHVGRQRLEYLETATRQRDEMTRELKMAAEVQRRLLPLQPPRCRGYDIAGGMEPVHLVGGDLYDYFKLPDDELGLVVADVSGKGVPAALLMPTVKTSLRMLVSGPEPTGEVLSKLNRIVFDVTDTPRYVSLFYGKLHLAERRLEYTNAGHPPPLLFRSASEEVLWLGRGGTVVGLLPEVAYENAVVDLKPGDILVIYTDGVTEAWSESDEAYSRGRLLELVATHREGTAAALLRAIGRSLLEFRGAHAVEDDATIIVVRVLDETNPEADEP